jgi:hypothetical protein
MRTLTRPGPGRLLTALVGLTLTATTTAGAQTESPRLPEVWLGTWSGEMLNLGSGAASDPISVLLLISAFDDGSYEWRTVYGDDLENGLRDYRLVPAPASSSTDFLIDERNGILLQARLLGSSLVTPFRVGNRTFLSRYTLEAEDRLIHEIIFWSDDDPLETMGTGSTGEDGQPVSSMFPGGIQRSVLRRVPPPD